jgi:hypothetical protein
VYQENLNQDQQDELLHARSLIGVAISPAAENFLTILKSTDLKLLLLLSTSGASEQEILRTARYMSNGNVKFCQDMNFLMESVSGTTVTSEL